MTTYTFSTFDFPLCSLGTDLLGINSSGQISGTFYDGGDIAHGFLYSSGTYTILNDPLGYNGTIANGINAGGQIVGSYKDSSDSTHNFLYSGGNYINLSDPAGSANGTRAIGINAAGQIVGNYWDSSDTEHGFVYSGGSYAILNNPFNNLGTVAYGINDAGRVVGNYWGSNGDELGFVYSGGTYTTLSAPLGANGTRAIGVNATGQIVGNYWDSSDASHGFVYSGASFTTLNNPLNNLDTYAFSINDAGQIVGYYIDSRDVEHGFIAKPVSSADDYPAATLTTGRIAIGGATSGQIENLGDHDWFAVTLSAGQNYLFGLDAASSNGLSDPYLRVRDSSGAILASDDDSGSNSNSLIIFTAPTNGTYYLDAAGYSSQTGYYAAWARAVVGGTSDIFISGASNETFDGGAGDNTIVFDGPVYQYTIDRSGGAIIVNDSVANGNGTDKLVNIQHAQFTDRSINFTMQAEAAEVSTNQLNSLIELYVAYFNRVPEASGLSYWIDRVAGGESLAQVSREFYAAGVQFSSVTGYSANMSNADFIKIVYANVLDRTGSTVPNASEINYWDNQITSGAVTKEGLIQRMLSDAHLFANDPTWGWVPQLLNNKIYVANAHAVQFGIDYNSPTESILNTVAIVQAITPNDTNTAIDLIGLSNHVYL